jgi:hypothetical protein
MKRSFVVGFALAIALSLLAASDSITMDVRWVRAPSPFSEVRDGVCVLYMGDSESGLEVGASQLEQCRNGALALPATVPAGAKRITFYKADAWDEFAAVFARMYGRPIYGDALRGYPGGFYHLEADGTCSVVYRAKAAPIAVGHEIKHCFDGNFHDIDHKWVTK